jgi:hypothetical protein
MMKKIILSLFVTLIAISVFAGNDTTYLTGYQYGTSITGGIYSLTNATFDQNSDFTGGTIVINGSCTWYGNITGGSIIIKSGAILTINKDQPNPNTIKNYGTLNENGGFELLAGEYTGYGCSIFNINAPNSSLQVYKWSISGSGLVKSNSDNFDIDGYPFTNPSSNSNITFDYTGNATDNLNGTQYKFPVSAQDLATLTSLLGVSFVEDDETSGCPDLPILTSSFQFNGPQNFSDSVSFTWQANSSSYFTLQGSTDGINWATLVDSIPGNISPNTQTYYYTYHYSVITGASAGVIAILVVILFFLFIKKNKVGKLMTMVILLSSFGIIGAMSCNKSGIGTSKPLTKYTQFKLISYNPQGSPDSYSPTLSSN